MIKIYKLVFNDLVVYVGKTELELERRKQLGYGKNVQFYKECEIELIEETDDVSRERFWIEYYLSIGCPLLNILKGDGLDRKEYSKEYYEDNKDYFIEYHKNYGKKYYEENRDSILKRTKEYKELNKEKIKEYSKEYYEDNKEKMNEYSKKYNEDNKEKLKEYRKNYYKNKKTNKLVLETNI
jgi:hypothetical protein